MKKSTLLKFIKPLLFGAILCAVFSATFSVLWMKEDLHTTSVRRFYELPENSVDAILIGSSAITEYYIAPEAFHHNGVAMYCMGTGNQPFGCVRYLIEESLKTQRPKVFVVDIRTLSYPEYKDWEIRRVTDSMKFTSTRLRMIDTLLPFYQELHPEEDVNPMDYYFSFRKYHVRWEDITPEDFVLDPNLCFGYLVNTRVDSYDPVTLPETRRPLLPSNEKVLRELLEYCKTLDTPVLFVDVPAIYENEVYEQLNEAKAMIREAGFEVLNLYARTEEMGLDYASDFKVYDHVNSFGALKITDWLADYLAEKYGIAPHTESGTYVKWTDGFERFSRLLLTETKRSDKYMEVLPRYENTTIVISGSGDAAQELWPDTYAKMRACGLNPEPQQWTDTRYLAVLSDGKPVYESLGAGAAYSGKCGEKTLSVSCGGGGCSVLLDGVNYGTAHDGLLFTVLDNATGEVLDSVCFSAGQKSEAFRNEEL